MPTQTTDITGLLRDWSQGNTEAVSELIPLVFDDLRRMASNYLRKEPIRITRPNATGLVNEVFLRLLQRETPLWKSRGHFFGVVAQEMRRILVSRTRKRSTKKKGDGEQPTSLEDALSVAKGLDVDLVALDMALRDLAEIDTKLVQVVELRFFAGLNWEEIAQVMEISVSTVRRRWAAAQAWLYKELAESTPPKPTFPLEDLNNISIEMAIATQKGSAYRKEI